MFRLAGYGYVQNDPVNWVDPWGLRVNNNTGTIIHVKPEGTGEAKPVNPGDHYDHPVDGVTYPNKEDGQNVYKISDPYSNCEIDVSDKGVNLPGPNVINNLGGGGTKDQDFLDQRHEEGDTGWDAIFDAASPRGSEQ